MSLSLTFVLLSLLAMQSLSSFHRYMADKTDSINQSHLMQTSIQLEHHLQTHINLMNYLATENKLLKDLYTFKTAQPGLRRNVYGAILHYIDKIKQQNPYIKDIILLTDSGTLHTSGNLTLFENPFNLESIPAEYYHPNTHDRTIFFVQPRAADAGNTSSYFDEQYGFITPLYMDQAFLGVLFIALKSTIFENVLLQDNPYVLINAQNQRVWSEKGLEEKNLTLLDIESHYSVSLFNGYFTLFLLTDNKTMIGYVDLLKWILTALAISLLIALFLSKIISKKITQPLQDISHSIKEYKIHGQSKACMDNSKHFHVTLRETILYYLMAVIILPMVVFMASSYIVQNRWINFYVANAQNRVFSHTVQNSNDYLNLKEKMLRNIIYNDTIQNALFQATLVSEPVSEPVSEDEIISIVDRSVQLSPGKDLVTLYDTDFNLVFTNSIPIQAQEYDAAYGTALFQNNDTILVWHTSSKDAYNGIMLNVLLKVNSLGSLKTVGYVHCQIPESEIASIYNPVLEEGTALFIVNSENRVISHKDKLNIHTIHDHRGDTIQKDPFLQLLKPLGNTGLHFVGQYSTTMLQIDQRRFLNEKLYLLMVLLILIAGISFLFSYSLTKPLGKFRSLLSMVSMDNIEILFPEENIIQEINELGHSFNEMILRNEQLIDDLLLSVRIHSQLAEQKKDAEIIALQAQINPHFLYNTFDSINWMIKGDNKKQALYMINHLSNLLRYAAKSYEPLVKIAEEIDYIRSYSKILNLRFDNRLDFVWEVNPDILDCTMIRLTLQPLLENAIYH